MSYTSPLFRLMEDINPTIAGATAQILRDVCKDFSQIDHDSEAPISSKFINDLLKKVPLNTNKDTDKEHECMHRFDDRYEVNIDAPGVKKENIDIDVDEMFINISAERHLFDGSVKKQERKILIRDDMDAEKISANLEDGVLIVRMPLKSIQLPSVGRKIKIA